MDGISVSTARRLRIAAVALLIAWFFSARLQSIVPLWLPFLVYAGLELNFLVGGLRERGSAPRARGRIPQASDIDELGGEDWLEPVLVEIDGQDVWLPAGGKTDEEVEELVEAARERVQRGEDAVAPEEPVSRAPAPRRDRLLARLEGLAVVAVLAFVLFVLVPDGGWSGLDQADRDRTEARLSAEAARIAGHDASVHCDAAGDAVGVIQHADGLAQVGGRNAYLTPDICYRLYRLAFKHDEGAFSQTARAIAVLAHESWHLHGESDEGVTNCYAFQSGVGLGERLGLSEGTAARMMRQQLADNAIYAQSAREYLVPSECKNGGELDLAPAVNRFP
jgi:hypothetical protein